MTQTNLTVDLASNPTTSPLSLGWSEAQTCVQQLATKPAFIERLTSAGLPNEDKTSLDYAKALSARAGDYCASREQDGSINRSLADQIKLLANVSFYLHNQKEISYYEQERDNRRLTDEQWQYYQDFKPYMIWYNQLLSDYAYSNPRATLSDLNNNLIAQALPSFPGEIEAVERNVKRATRGARTEAASRELLDRTHLDYSPGTIEDDLRGGDLIVTYNGHRVKVDIKSSLSDVAAVRGGYQSINEHQLSYAILKTRRDGNDKAKHVVVLFPGFTDGDFGDWLSLQLPEQAIQKHADKLAAQLELAFRELQL